MKKILWRGILYKSWEHCTLQQEKDGLAVRSIITGNYQNQLFSVNYTLKLDEKWRIQEFEIRSDIDGKTNYTVGRRIGKDWWINDSVIPELTGLLYIDISLTPFTNTLPVNHLLLEIGKSSDIDVLYIDLLENEIKPVRQRYTRKAKYQYLYESLDYQFEAVITVDPKGIVTSYPGLFEEVVEGRMK